MLRPSQRPGLTRGACWRQGCPDAVACPVYPVGLRPNVLLPIPIICRLPKPCNHSPISVSLQMKGVCSRPIHLFSSLTRWPIYKVGRPFTFAPNRPIKPYRRGQPCQRLSVSFQKDAPAKTDAESLVCTDSSIKAPKEERPCMTEGCGKKGETAGSGSAGGRV